MNDPKNNALPPAAYVNFLRIARNPSEIFLAFGQVASGQDDAAHLVSSLVTTPPNAKAMLHALSEAVRMHEEQFGEIQLGEPPAALAPERDAAGRRGSAVAPRRARASKADGAEKATRRK